MDKLDGPYLGNNLAKKHAQKYMQSNAQEIAEESFLEGFASGFKESVDRKQSDSKAKKELAEEYAWTGRDVDSEKCEHYLAGFDAALTKALKVIEIQRAALESIKESRKCLKCLERQYESPQFAAICALDETEGLIKELKGE